jgi:hypothetical protein
LEQSGEDLRRSELASCVVGVKALRLYAWRTPWGVLTVDVVSEVDEEAVQGKWNRKVG